MGIRGERVGMATKAALEPSQLESHITSLMRASFGRLKVIMSYTHAPVFTHIPLQQPYASGLQSKLLMRGSFGHLKLPNIVKHVPLPIHSFGVK